MGGRTQKVGDAVEGGRIHRLILGLRLEQHSDGRAIILGGDTNLHTDDTHPDAADGADTEIWQEFLERTGLTDACDATGCPEPGSIDKIAYRSGEGVEIEAVSHEMPRERFTTPDGEPLSDHPPVVVELRWRPRG